VRFTLLHRYRAALASRSLVRYLAGYAASMFGDSVSCVVLLWLASRARGEPADVALVLIAYSAPGLVTGPFAGRLLDRYDRRRLLIADNVIRAAAFLAIPMTAVAREVPLALLVAVAAIHGAVGAITLAGGAALLADLVEEEGRAAANALELLALLVAQTAGYFVAGTFLAFVDGPCLVLIDCASYLVFAVCLTSIRVQPAPQAIADAPFRPATHPFASRIILSTTIALVIVNLGAGAIVLLATAFARPEAGGEARLFAMLLTALSIGQCAGAFASAGIGERWPLGRRIAVALTLCGASLAALARTESGVAACLIFAAVGALVAPVNAWVQTLRMRLIPREARGRAFAVIRTAIRSTLPVSAALGAMLLDRTSFQTTTVAMAALIGLPGVWALATGAFEEGVADPPAHLLKGEES
jgi:MFS family permease